MPKSAEHESLHAVCRSIALRFGADDGARRIREAMAAMRVVNGDQLSPFGANFIRKLLERSLPECVS